MTTDNKEKLEQLRHKLTELANEKVKIDLAYLMIWKELTKEERLDELQHKAFLGGSPVTDRITLGLLDDLVQAGKLNSNKGEI